MTEIHSGDAVTIRHIHVRRTKRGKKAVVRPHKLGFWQHKALSYEEKMAREERALALKERKAAIKVSKLQAKAGIIDAKANRLVGKAQQRLSRAEGLRAKADAGFFRGAIRNTFAERRNTRATLLTQRHEANTQRSAIIAESHRLALEAGIAEKKTKLDAERFKALADRAPTPDEIAGEQEARFLATAEAAGLTPKQLADAIKAQGGREAVLAAVGRTEMTNAIATGVPVHDGEFARPAPPRARIKKDAEGNPVANGPLWAQ
jgi:hypothetical protein